MTEAVGERRAVRCVCGGGDFEPEPVFTYSAPPAGEVRFDFSSGPAYWREIRRCAACGHFVSLHDMNPTALYTGGYVDANYGALEGIRKAFERITSLDPAQSDNAGRVRYVREQWQRHVGKTCAPAPRVLDVGSGLCVFLHGMKQAGWDCTAVDPDARAVEHARCHVGVRAVCGDFLTIELNGPYDLITLNKVLEHVADPVVMLARTRSLMSETSGVYVEVPDGEAAVTRGPEREEFFIDHLHVFSPASLALLAARAGFALWALDRLREPSGKYTLRAFLRLLVPAAASAP